jgi:COP9 signalosome complex subunit 6
MASEAATPNPLLISDKTAPSGLQVNLHPLALLSVSDYITRHRLRQHPGPIIGGLLGQHDGRVLSIDVAFEVLARETDDGSYELDPEAFRERISQCTSEARLLL